MKVDLDARTLEAMRVLTGFPDYRIGPESKESIAALRAFLAAYDSARDAERDEALAVAIVNAGNKAPIERLSQLHSVDLWILRARAARDFIAKEQEQ